MIVYYDPADSNQVQAIYSGDTGSTAWGIYTRIEVTDPAMIAQIRQNRRDCKLTVVAGAVTAVTPNDHSGDHSLANHKAGRKLAVDVRTQELIAAGFTYSATLFSLSANAQMNWTNLYAYRVSWTYPMKISTAADGEYSLANQAAVESFYDTGILFVKGHIDSGRQLKVDIDAAADQAALDAIVDTR